MRQFIFCFSLFILSLAAKSQNFNYSVSTDSLAWQELNSQTILNVGDSAWHFSYKIPIGFSFNFLGRSFDSLKIETNGYVVFDNDHSYALTAFHDFGDCVDTNGHHGVLGYELSGTNGNHILKIQFKNTGTSLVSSKHFSYQIWIRENNSLEVHVGPNDFQPGLLVTNDSSFVESVLIDSLDQHTDSLVIAHDTIYYNMDSMQTYRIGLINMNMDSQSNGLFIGGNTSSPQSQPVNANNPEPIYLMRAPSSGTRYTFTPNFN